MDVFQNKKDLIAKVGIDEAHLAWAKALYLEDADIDALAAAALTDSRSAPHPTTRKRPRETLRPFAPRTQTFGVSGCSRCLRRVANARKF
jgi:hypothetical protein